MPRVDTIAIKRIQMMYPKSYEELISYLARLFTLNIHPAAIVVDDLDDILNRRESNNQSIEHKKTYKECLSHLMALLLDNVHHLRKSEPPCDILVATSFGDNGIDDSLVIKTFAEHFFDQVYRIEYELVREPACYGLRIFTKDDLLKFRLLVEDDEVKIREISRKKKVKIEENSKKKV